jgi:hypothetical protein
MRVDVNKVMRVKFPSGDEGVELHCGGEFGGRWKQFQMLLPKGHPAIPAGSYDVSGDLDVRFGDFGRTTIVFIPRVFKPTAAVKAA